MIRAEMHILTSMALYVVIENGKVIAETWAVGAADAESNLALYLNKNNRMFLMVGEQQPISTAMEKN